MDVATQPAALGPTLEEHEIIRLCGGYSRPTEQLRELHLQGYWRARRSTFDGRVILERPHFEAVSRGADLKPPPTEHAPKLRKPAKKPVPA